MAMAMELGTFHSNAPFGSRAEMPEPEMGTDWNSEPSPARGTVLSARVGSLHSGEHTVGVPLHPLTPLASKLSMSLLNWRGAGE